MKKLTNIFAAALLSMLSLPAEQIFDGKTLEGWSGTPGVWKVEDEAITAEIKAGDRLRRNEFIFYKEKMADFVLELEYKITGGPTANSGIQYRSKKQGHSAKGYQADIDAGKTWLGRIYDEHGRALLMERGNLTTIDKKGKRQSFKFRDAKDLGKLAKKDDWNSYKIIARGHRTEIHINGVHFSTLEDYQDGQFDLEGLLAFQLHSGVGPAKIQFRNIHLTSLEANTIPKKEEKEQKNPAFTPKDFPNIGFEKGDLSGWTIEGEAFKGQPITREKSRRSLKHSGQYFIGGYELLRSDKPTGSLTSKAFTVTHPWATLKVSGGSSAKNGVEIYNAKNNELITRVSGRNTDQLSVQKVKLKSYLNQKIYLKIIDQNSGGWGITNYDDFLFYEREPQLDSGLKQSPVLMHLGKNPQDSHEKATTTNAMYVPNGFKVETIATEPLLRQPIAFTFDAKGRIWVAEAFAYPRRAKEGQGKDRLVILEDKDGDGKFETHKVFKDDLNLISGFEIGYGGVYVGTAPTISFIPDKDGDDKPDGPAEVLLDGWDLRDTHETPNSFMWGHDGWLYGTHGLYNNSFVGKPGTPRKDRIRVNAGIWRFHPVSKKFEIYAQGGSNQWGLDMNSKGQMFMTHCRSAWGLGPVTQVFRDGHYWSQENRDHYDFIATHRRGYVRRETPLNNMMRGVAAYGHGEGGAGTGGSRSIFGGHSHVGTMLYLGDNWPEDYRDNLFTHNLHGKQMNRHLIQDEDSAVLSHSHGREQLFVSDKRYLGVDLKYGPDGAVYIIDWYDSQQCHTNNVERWDRTNGRVYRMQYEKTFKPAAPVDLTKASDNQLIKYLSHTNEWYARQAQHELRQRAVAGTVKASTKNILKAKLFDAANTNRFRTLVALYAVNGIDSVTYKKLFKDSDETIRSQAIHFLTEAPLEESAKYSTELIDMAKNETSATVRLALAGATQRRLDKALALEIITILSQRTDDLNDRFVAKMLFYGFAQFVEKDIDKAFALADKSPLAEFRRSIYWYVAKKNTNAFVAKLASVKSNEQFEDYLDLLQQQFFVENKKKRDTPAQWDTIQARVKTINKASLNKINDKIIGYIDPSKAKKATKAEIIAKGKQAFLICQACHVSGKDQPGPSLEEISKVYKDKKGIIDWIKKPGKKRANYPAMPGFPHMPAEDLDALAEYLLSLGKK